MSQQDATPSRAALSATIDPRRQADATLHSTPETVLWGYLAANLPPALTIQSGQTVEIEALSHQGLTTSKDPENFLPLTALPQAKYCPTRKPFMPK